ncbi:MAG: hypothetical protein M1816_000647 [Peltula sp. TS41687]|nr:MAG: hypothetical protein M1816_000647 [Peltula sp. TS41687]
MGRSRPLLILGCLSATVIAGEVARPYGVGPEFAKFYKSADSFTCISNPTIQIPASQVNDDYCDCPDGSDEPGTSACSYISPLSPGSPIAAGRGSENYSLALPGFYCKNKNHRPAYVPFTQVNDGICDYDLCCDGTDEWKRIGGVVCADRCKEIGKEWRKQDEARKKGLGAALKKRREMLALAILAKSRIEENIAVLMSQIDVAEGKVRILQRELEEVEKRERSKVVKGQGGKLNVLVDMAKERIEELREALLGVRTQRNVAVEKVKELEKLLSTLKEEYNPNFNDEGVKRALRAWEEYTGRRDTAVEGDMTAQERDLDEIVKADGEGEGGINWADWQGEHTESDVDILYKFEAYLPASIRTWVHQKLHSFHEYLISSGVLAGPSSSASSSAIESKAVTDARSALNAAQSDLTTAQSKLTSEKQDLGKDYGPDDIFRVMKGKCVSANSGEYTYELCFMERTTQKPKKGGSDTNMGSFSRFDKVTVDEQIPADGRGLGSGERITMVYDNGQHCWNGPSRSTTVVLACAENDEIWKVVEAEKCVYRMEVGTPAVCESAETSSAESKEGDRDEL